MKADFEDAVDVHAANERLAKMGINGDAHGGRGMTLREVMEAEDPEPRSPTGKRIRSDAGKSRPKPEAPAPAQSGPLTEQQWARVIAYFENIAQSASDLASAEWAHTALLAEAHSYFDSLKGGA